MMKIWFSWRCFFRAAKSNFLLLLNKSVVWCRKYEECVGWIDVRRNVYFFIALQGRINMNILWRERKLTWLAQLTPHRWIVVRKLVFVAYVRLFKFITRASLQKKSYSLDWMVVVCLCPMLFAGHYTRMWCGYFRIFYLSWIINTKPWCGLDDQDYTYFWSQLEQPHFPCNIRSSLEKFTFVMLEFFTQCNTYLDTMLTIFVTS